MTFPHFLPPSTSDSFSFSVLSRILILSGAEICYLQHLLQKQMRRSFPPLLMPLLTPPFPFPRVPPAGPFLREAQHHCQHCDHFLPAGVRRRGCGLLGSRVGLRAQFQVQPPLPVSTHTNTQLPSSVWLLVSSPPPSSGCCRGDRALIKRNAAISPLIPERGRQ